MQADPAPSPCAVQVFRWAEDCRGLAGQSLIGTDRLRYLPLVQNGAAWLTLGGELRGRAEHQTRPDFGIANPPDFTAFTARAYLHADLRTKPGPRVFVQLSASDQDGRRPGPRTVDESGLDLAQAFVDVPVGPVTLRAGRQELNLAGNRLVAVRDGVLRRSFEGVQAQATTRLGTVTAFGLRPVAVGAGTFDDSPIFAETFAGATWQSAPRHGATWGLYAFERRREQARVFSASGTERRRTWGGRYGWHDAHWDVAAQGAWQEGTLAGQPIRAVGWQIEAGRRVGSSGARLGAVVGYASGDDQAGDGRIGSFDPLYPNLAVYTDAPLYFPTNQVNVEANVTLHPAPPLTLRFNAVVLARATLGDAIYAASGRPLAAPPGDRLSAVLIEATARWTLSPHVELYGSLVRAKALDGVRAAGGDDHTFSLLQLTTRF